MPRKNAPEMSWLEDKQLYRKRIKNPDTGKWADVYGKTKQEVRDKVKAQERRWAEDAAAAESPYVYQYAARWYELNTKGLGAKRQADYKNAINNHICPIIGQKLIKDITYDDVLSVMAAASELSKSSQQKIVTTLKRIFDAAELNDLIKRSPCRNLTAGGAPAAEKEALTKKQQATLIEAVRDTKAYVFVLGALYTGLRREELLGLQWDCVHLDADTPYISVRRALKWDGGGRPTVSEDLKSKAAKRDIPIPSQLVECLKDEKAKTTGNYVISNASGKPMSAHSFRNMWGVIETRSERTITKMVDGKPQEVRLKVGDKIQNHKVYISIDFPVTPHQLRHTYITSLILAGANIKTVQYLAGHSNVSITLNIYTHLMEHQPRDTVHAVLAAFAPEQDQEVKSGVYQGEENGSSG